MWTQDRARCYMEKKVWQYCKTTFKDFWLPDFSLPSSPYQNLLDIAGYGVLEHFDNKTCHLNSVLLRAAILKGGAVSLCHILVQTCKSFPQGVEAVIAYS